MTIKTLARIALSIFALTMIGNVRAEAQALTLEQAKSAMDAAEAEARRNGWNLTIVIASADGVPMYLRRMDGASTRSYDIAMAKIHTAITARMATGAYGQALAAGQIRDTIPNAITFEGGYPLLRGGELIGAMSASGARGSEDAQAVRAGMAAIDFQP